LRIQKIEKLAENLENVVVATGHTGTTREDRYATDVIFGRKKGKETRSEDFLGIGNRLSKANIKVLSLSSHKIYNIVYLEELNAFICECPAYIFRKRCKHIEAIELIMRTEGINSDVIYAVYKNKKDKSMKIGTLYPAKGKIYDFIGYVDGKLVCLKPIYDVNSPYRIVKYEVLELDSEKEAEFFEAVVQKNKVKTK